VFHFFFFAADGPTAMVRDAVLYGGMMYVLTLWTKKSEPFRYEEAPLEF
jgi:hypothetical protein